MTTNQKLKDLITQADEAINREDFDTLMKFYCEDAVLVVMPGKIAAGKEQIRQAVTSIAEYFNHSLEVSQSNMEILVSGDVALVVANTVVKADQGGESTYLQNRKATYVFKYQASGEWLCAIDNSYGTDLIQSI